MGVTRTGWRQSIRKSHVQHGHRMWVRNTRRKTWRQFGTSEGSECGVRTYRRVGKRLYKRALRKYYKQLAKLLQFGGREAIPPHSLAHYLTQLHETW